MATGEAIAERHRRHQDFLKFLAEIDAVVPAELKPVRGEPHWQNFVDS